MRHAPGRDTVELHARPLLAVVEHHAGKAHDPALRICGAHERIDVYFAAHGRVHGDDRRAAVCRGGIADARGCHELCEGVANRLASASALFKGNGVASGEDFRTQKGFLVHGGKYIIGGVCCGSPRFPRPRALRETLGHGAREGGVQGRANSAHIGIEADVTIRFHKAPNTGRLRKRNRCNSI